MPERAIFLDGRVIWVDEHDFKPFADAIFPDVVGIQQRKIRVLSGCSLFCDLFEALSPSEFRNAKRLRSTSRRRSLLPSAAFPNTHSCDYKALLLPVTQTSRSIETSWILNTLDSSVSSPSNGRLTKVSFQVCILTFLPRFRHVLVRTHPSHRPLGFPLLRYGSPPDAKTAR